MIYMKALYEFLTESMLVESFNIPSFTVSAMLDLLACKSVADVTNFFTDQGYEEEDYDSNIIFKSIQLLNKECEFSGVNVKPGIFDNPNKQEIVDEYGLSNYNCWVIYMTEGDSQMLLIAGKKHSAEKVLKEFVKGCDRDVDILTSWDK